MTQEQRNIAGLAHFSLIAYEYWQASHESLIRLGTLYNSTKYKARFTGNRKQQRDLTKKMEAANKALIKSIMDEGKHLEALVGMVDGLNDQDKAEKITEGLYEKFDELTR
jgi:hypothetical protein